MSDSLNQQGQALENQFFFQLDEQLLAKLKEDHAKRPAREMLATATGIKNPVVIDKLLDLGINATTYAALTFVPLAAVAWADGSIDAAERGAILRAAEEHHVAPGSTGHQLLENWLKHPPGPELLHTWKEYVHELRKVVDPEWIAALRVEVLDKAAEIAHVSGGFLGLVQTVSPAEKRKLAELAQAFDGPLG